MKMRHPSCQSAIMSAIPALKAPFGAQRHSQIFGRHLNFESATLALKRQIWQPCAHHSIVSKTSSLNFRAKCYLTHVNKYRRDLAIYE